ncbi:RNase P/MRP, p29 subunit [Eremomyces bilateralis CBS 781.70]|uniref:RNase P/MRP, p29 subunit n=1 Tax=Eremomyces bilateralis CBS 781.70 TaxID=1392243 RepID=A0A6G1G889_9PEZI|nr:RNase P/MRP, p29 subunit [Eremomyces bilateralis CBS 781.70]KAF1814146.1 RNase P/MRP, p29 subunit [Eremomyces bilateralis CBS 781.70]
MTSIAQPRKPLHPAEALLSLAHPPTTAASLFKSTVSLKPLPFIPNTQLDPSAARDARDRRRLARERKQEAKLAQRKFRASGKPKPLSAKMKRALGVHKISKEEKRWEIYVPLWAMWADYVRGLLGIDADEEEGKSEDAMEGVEDGEAKQSKKHQFVSVANGGPLLASADFHGAYLEVVQCRCVSRVGLRGIVLKDTKFTYEMITRDNEIKVVPKEFTILRMELPLASNPAINSNGQVEGRTLVFELHGSRLQNRAPDRANKKLKDTFRLED